MQQSATINQAGDAASSLMRAESSLLLVDLAEQHLCATRSDGTELREERLEDRTGEDRARLEALSSDVKKMFTIS